MGVRARRGGASRTSVVWSVCGLREPVAQVIIVAGHSLYFRQFFRTFLPHACEHVSKNKKIANGKHACEAAPRAAAWVASRAACARRWRDRV